MVDTAVYFGADKANLEHQSWARVIFVSTRHRVMPFYRRVTRHRCVFQPFSRVIAILHHVILNMDLKMFAS